MPALDITGSLESVLPLYYKRIFPFEPYYRWLSYGSPEYFCRREFSYTFGNDIFVRYQSFDSLEDLITQVQKRIPTKIDIGAVCNYRPKHHKRIPYFAAVQKELVFDIDLTDYDEVRTCCQGADVCEKCWKFMVVACKIIEIALKEDFGYTNLLWVFSGRRGIHCWVCDPAARRLPNHCRSAVAEYLNVIRGGLQRTKKVVLPGDQLHNSILRAFGIAEPYFKEICLEDQDILGTEERVDVFLKIVIAVGDCETLKVQMLNKQGSVARWEVFVDHYKSQRHKGLLSKNARNLIEEIVLQYVYPRIDINVTKGVNHLLKGPFSIHPKTGKISIPFNAATVERFSPVTVPTIGLLVQEINQFDQQVQSERGDGMQVDSEATSSLPSADATAARIKDYKKTSLYKAIILFENFVRNLTQIPKDILLDF